MHVRGRADSGWLAGAAIALASVALVMITVWWEAAYGRARADLHDDAGAGVNSQAGRAIWWGVVLIGYPIVGVVILKFRRRNLIGWLFCAIYACFAVVLAAQAAGTWSAGTPEFIRSTEAAGGTFVGSPVPAWADSLLSRIEPLATVLATTLLFAVVLLYPTGRLPSRRWAWVPLLMGTSMLMLFAPALVSTGITRMAVGLGVTGFVASAVGACASLLWRYRRSDGIERLQLRWAAFGVTVAACVAIVGVLLVRSEAIQLPVITAVGLFPLATGYAIIRYRLYGIDAVIHRGLVLLLLGLFAVALYAAIVVALDVALGRFARPGVGTSLVAATAVAMCVLPARPPVERWVARVVYGRRADARTVLSTFSTRLDQPDAAQQLVLLARLIAEVTGATTVRVWVRAPQSHVLEPAAVFPAEAPWPRVAGVSDAGLLDIGDADLTMPITHEGVVLGAVSLTKARGNPVSAQDRSVLEDLSRQAGLVLRNADLTRTLSERVEQLSASRRQLLTAHDAARRQLERDLHDGAQHLLLAIKLKVGVAEVKLQRAELSAAQVLLAELLVETDEAIGALRNLARGIYPPLLEARGIVAALVSETAGFPLPVSVRAADVGRYPTATEATVYFCALEAIQNVVKHAAASEVVLTLRETDGALELTVEDDGRGLDSAFPRGSGLANMEDRMQAAGGSLSLSSRPGWGTRVRGTIPLPTSPQLPT